MLCTWLVVPAKVCLVWINWVAPSTTPGTVQSMQATVAGNLLHQNGRNIGLLLSPLYSYKRGGLWLLEYGAQKALVQSLAA